MNCCAYGEGIWRVRPFGKQTAVGSSTRTLPVCGRKKSDLPSGVNEGMLLSVYSLTVALSVSLPVCLNPGPAHTPEKSGLPSGVRGMLSGGACEQATHRTTTAVSNTLR